jgi:hypothetical protein
VVSTVIPNGLLCPDESVDGCAPIQGYVHHGAGPDAAAPGPAASGAAAASGEGAGECTPPSSIAVTADGGSALSHAKCNTTALIGPTSPSLPSLITTPLAGDGASMTVSQ